MGKVTGFLEYQRLQEAAEDKDARKKHYREFVLHLTEDEAKAYFERNGSQPSAFLLASGWIPCGCDRLGRLRARCAYWAAKVESLGWCSSQYGLGAEQRCKLPSG